MKKYLLAILFFAFAFTTKAQWVPIPDTVFAQILLTDSWMPPCIQGNGTTGYLLDTTCNQVLHKGNVYCPQSSGVKSLECLQYFKAITDLSCTANSINYIPAFPASLQYITCWSNQLQHLPPLPAGLRSLRCYSNYLDSLPSLPASLTTLDCAHNLLTHLPPLPNSLTGLSCNNNYIGTLPALPTSLQGIDCSSNFLTILPALDAALVGIDCSNNYIDSLPALTTTSLVTLTCDNNYLTVLPTLPATLTTLECSYNPLTYLPQLPASLTTVYCMHDSLTYVSNLLSYMNVFDCRYNPKLHCLPKVDSIETLNFTYTGVQCLQQYPQYSPYCYPQVASGAWSICYSHNPYGCAYNNGYSFNDTICSGDTYSFYGQTLSTGGYYNHPLTNISGGDSFINLHLVVRIPPLVTLNLPDSICTTDSVFVLAASYAGGAFSGNGVADSLFNPTLVPAGKNIITYSFVGNYGCLYVIHDTVVVYDCNYIPCHAHYTIYPDTTTPHHWFALNESTGSGPLTFTWYWGDGSHSVGDTASHIYSLAGYYNMCLMVSDTSGCSNTYCDASTYVYKTEEVITINVVWQLPVSTGISKSAINNPQFAIFPNPASDKLFIQTNGTAIEQVNVYNTTGSLVMAVQQSTINIESLSNGIYVAEVKTKEGTVRKRWVKM